MSIDISSINRGKSSDFLENHFKTTQVNHIWLGEILGNEEVDPDFFPYQVKKEGKAEKGIERFTSDDKSNLYPSGKINDPVFLINIPMGVLPRATINVDSLLNKLYTESCGKTYRSYSKTSINSKLQAKNKLAVVIGLNQIKSIDLEVNALFKKQIQGLPCFSGIPYKIEGFFWIPEWEKNDFWKTKISTIMSGHVFVRNSAFFLLKCIDPKKAEKVRLGLEGGEGSGISESIRSQIPYQLIRENIKNSPSTQKFANQFSKETFKSPVFFTTMDSDCGNLRGDEGYFTLLEKSILEEKEKGSYPSVISLGYNLEDNAFSIPKLAVKSDMVVREAMNKIIKGSVYMPEPGTAYYMGEDLKTYLQKFSFISKGTSGFESRAYESRRAINNGIKNGIIDQEKIVFKNIVALKTQMPNRMSTIIIQKYTTLKSKDLKKKEVLKALRGVSQVHFSPLDWAHYVYEGLPDDIKKGEKIYSTLSGLLSKIFNVFDPIDGVYTIEKNSRYNNKFFDKTFKFYEKYTLALFEGERKNKVLIVTNKPTLIHKNELDEIDNFLQARISILLTAKAKLIELGLEDKWVCKIIDAAKASGEALYQVLKEEAGI